MAQNETEDDQARDKEPKRDRLIFVALGLGVLATALWVGVLAVALGFVISALAG